MKEKLRELRIYFCAGILVMMFLPWASMKTSAEVMDVSESMKESYSGLQMSQLTILGSLVFLIPFALLIMELVTQIHLDMKLFYLLGALLGIAIGVFGFIRLKSVGDMDIGGEVASVSNKLSPGIGFFGTIILYIVIVVYTLIKDYALSKQALKEKGVKGAFSEIAGDVTSGISEQVGKVQTGEFLNAGAKPSVKCPNCGADVAGGKKFCAKCGGKIQTAEQPQEKKSPSAGSSGKTVKQYLAKLKNITCESCGANVSAGTKFCPDCGTKIIIMVTPELCTCGAKLIEGKQFCPDCGAKVQKVCLQETCKKCGADLIYGKKFCMECGEKVEE